MNNFEKLWEGLKPIPSEKKPESFLPEKDLEIKKNIQGLMVEPGTLPLPNIKNEDWIKKLNPNGKLILSLVETGILPKTIIGIYSKSSTYARFKLALSKSEINCDRR